MRFATNIRGYSLMELLVVMLLLTILSAGFSRFHLKNRIKMACKKTERFLSNSQSKALATNTRINLEILNSEIKELDSNSKFTLPKGLTFQIAQFGNLLYGPKTISFEANSWSSPGKLTLLGNNDTTCTIYQSILGARRIE